MEHHSQLYRGNEEGVQDSERVYLLELKLKYHITVPIFFNKIMSQYSHSNYVLCSLFRIR